MLWNFNYRLYPKLGHFKNCLYSQWHFYTQANNNFAVFLPPFLGRLLSPEGKAKQSNDTHALASVQLWWKRKCVCVKSLGSLVPMKRTFLWNLSGWNCCITHKRIFITSFPADSTHSSVFSTLNIGTSNVLRFKKKIKTNEWWTLPCCDWTQMVTYQPIL